MSNDQCIHDQKTETDDPDQQDEADDITGNTNDNPTTIKDAREEDAPHYKTDEEGMVPAYLVQTRTTVKQSNYRT